ncbi:MAG: NAD(P)-binding protein [Alphaproteobacteria bacterium]|nr:NAD(P)-binding protein [Alphaproteobacteria bacterium]
MIEIGIVGGGPGGLMAARLLHAKTAGAVHITILEADARTGGKLVTGRFPESGLPYAAGVAEIYDYAALGPDPLAELIAACGLTSRVIGSRTSVIGGHVLPNLDAVERAFGKATRREIEAFRRHCAKTISPAAYYEGRADTPEMRALARADAQAYLNEHVRDDAARRFLRAAALSDIAVAWHNTNALNAIRNVLMDVDGYIELRSIDGGVSRLTDALAEDLRAKGGVDIRTGTRATRIGRTDDGRYRVVAAGGEQTIECRFDVLIVALPLSALAQIEWDGAALDSAMGRHIAYFDRPGHYLRVSVLFERPFWRETIRDDWWISDAFGGCCVYDESTRSNCGEAGVLGWLIAGNAALELANLDDAAIVARVLASLPAGLSAGAALRREAVVHRWLSSVNAVPGGEADRELVVNHVPEPAGHPGLIAVGDYIFDSTINAVLDSADAATDLALDPIVRLSRPARPARRIGAAHFANYRGLGPYEQVWTKFLDPKTATRLMRAVWRLRGPFKLLDAGSACGLGLAGFRAEGLDARGIEKNRAMHARTAPALARRNVHGDVCDLPFADGAFDIVYETCLAHLGDEVLPDALAELRRVARRGVFFGSVTAELALHNVERYELTDAVPRLRGYWEWIEHFRDAGFAPAPIDGALLARLWETVLAAGYGPDVWFEDAECLRDCFFTPVD